MMRRKWMEALFVLPVAVLAACGGVAETEQAVEGEGTRGVLYAPLELSLTERAITSQLQATLATGEARYSWTSGSLRRFDFAWTSSGEPTLAQADAAVLNSIQDYGEYAEYGAPGTVLTYPALLGYMYSEFQPLHSQILSTYGNGVENVQVMTHDFERLVAAGSTGWFRLNVILFPQSRKIIVFEQTAYEI